MTFELGIEGEKGLLGSVRLGESIIRITTDNYQTRHSFQAGQRHRHWHVLKMVNGPAA